jgi:hypothetical protein
MNELLDRVMKAHGGLDRWMELTTVTTTITVGGVLWEIKGQAEDMKPRTITAMLHQQRLTHTPFERAGRRTVYEPDRVAIETTSSDLVRERSDPRASFAGHGVERPWDPLHRAYFYGYTQWNYLTTPFFLALPGFEFQEAPPWSERGIAGGCCGCGSRSMPTATAPSRSSTSERTT